MGQSTSSQSNTNSSFFFRTFQSQFKPIDYKHQFQSGQIYINDANQEMVIEFPYRIFNHEYDEPWSKSQTMIKKIQAPYIIDYYGSIEKQTSEICSTSITILSYFEFIPQNLEKEIIQRKSHSEKFSEKEIWYFLWTISYALYDLKQKGYNHRDLRPANIGLKSNGQIKLCPIGIIIDQENSINKYINNKLETYIPSFLKKQLSQNQQPKIQWNQIDSYALGNTLLDLMTLNLDKKINDQKILELQNQCYNHYSIQLIRIMELLMAESENLLVIDDVYYLLKPYQNKIINFQDFIISYEEVKQNALPLNNTLKCKYVIESFSNRYSHLTSSQQHQRAQSEIIYETQQQHQQQSIQIETQHINQQIQPQQISNLESQRSQFTANQYHNEFVSNKLGNQDMFQFQQQSQFRVQDLNRSQQQLQNPNQQPQLLQKILQQSQLIPTTQQPQQQVIQNFPQISPKIYTGQSYNQTSPQVQSSPNVIVGPSPTILDQPIDPANLQILQKQQIPSQVPIGSKIVQPSVNNIQIPQQRYPAQNQVYDVINPKPEIQYGIVPQNIPNQLKSQTFQTVYPTNQVINAQNLNYNGSIPQINKPYQINNQNLNLNVSKQPINLITQNQVPNQNFTTPIQTRKVADLPQNAQSQIYQQQQQPIPSKQVPVDNFRQQYHNFDRIQNVLQDSEDLLQQINK